MGETGPNFPGAWGPTSRFGVDPPFLASDRSFPEPSSPGLTRGSRAGRAPAVVRPSPEMPGSNPGTTGWGEIAPKFRVHGVRRHDSESTPPPSAGDSGVGGSAGVWAVISMPGRWALQRRCQSGFWPCATSPMTCLPALRQERTFSAKKCRVDCLPDGSVAPKCSIKTLIVHVGLNEPTLSLARPVFEPKRPSITAAWMSQKRQMRT